MPIIDRHYAILAALGTAVIIAGSLAPQQSPILQTDVAAPNGGFAATRVTGTGATSALPANSSAASVTTLRGNTPAAALSSIATQRLLNLLPPAELWRELTEYDDEGNDQARQQRMKMALACALWRPVLGAPHVQGDVPNLQDAFCTQLRTLGDERYFAKQVALMAADQGFVQRSHWLADLYPEEMTAAQRQLIDANLRDMLTVSRDPLQISEIVGGLALAHSDIITTDWAGLDRLPDLTRDELVFRTLPGAVACRMIGGCGPNNPWTVEYCTQPGKFCAPGMSYADAVLNNLPPALLPLFNATLDHVMSQIAFTPPP